MNHAAITFDIDWAPDWAVALCAEICQQKKSAATFFVTHQSEIISDLNKDPNIELGIHPNFQMPSSHGKSFEEVMDYCLAIVPKAESIRTHGLFQTTSLFAKMQVKYPCIKTDVSLFLPEHRNLAPVFWHLDRELPPFTRIPYFWEDDISASNPNWNWDQNPAHHEGLRIFNFHPIHVALNTSRMDQYYALKTQLAGRDLKSITINDIRTFENRGSGTRTFLEKLVSSADGQNLQLISKIGQTARSTSHFFLKM